MTRPGHSVPFAAAPPCAWATATPSTGPLTSQRLCERLSQASKTLYMPKPTSIRPTPQRCTHPPLAHVGFYTRSLVTQLHTKTDTTEKAPIPSFSPLTLAHLTSFSPPSAHELSLFPSYIATVSPDSEGGYPASWRYCRLVVFGAWRPYA